MARNEQEGAVARWSERIVAMVVAILVVHFLWIGLIGTVLLALVIGAIGGLAFHILFHGDAKALREARKNRQIRK